MLNDLEKVRVPRAIDYGYRISRLIYMDGEKIPINVSELPEIAKYISCLGLNPLSPDSIEANIRLGLCRFAGHGFLIL